MEFKGQQSLRRIDERSNGVGVVIVEVAGTQRLSSILFLRISEHGQAF